MRYADIDRVHSRSMLLVIRRPHAVASRSRRAAQAVPERWGVERILPPLGAVAAVHRAALDAIADEEENLCPPS